MNHKHTSTNLFSKLYHIIRKPSDLLSLHPNYTHLVLEVGKKEIKDFNISKFTNAYKRNILKYVVILMCTLATVVSMRSCFTNCETMVLSKGKKTNGNWVPTIQHLLQTKKKKEGKQFRGLKWKAC